MATRWEIEMDFTRAKAQANRLDEIAESISRASGRLGGTLRGVQSGWTGESSAAYVKKGEQLNGKVDSSVGDLRNIASTIRRVAEETYRTEMANLSILDG